MIDLSNNNGKVDFKRLYASGFRRVYLKRSEGVSFADPKHDAYRAAALKAGLKVGEYHFAHPDQNTAAAEAEHFVALLPKLRWPHSLRPCLDLETGTPSMVTAEWAHRFVDIVRNMTGHVVVVYGDTDYLARCKFKRTPGPLWLASYGRNDGKEHPYRVPAPWTQAAAHQFTSQAKVAGVQGVCDVSHVLHPSGVDVHPWPLR